MGGAPPAAVGSTDDFVFPLFLGSGFSDAVENRRLMIEIAANIKARMRYVIWYI